MIISVYIFKKISKKYHFPDHHLDQHKKKFITIFILTAPRINHTQTKRAKSFKDVN